MCIVLLASERGVVARRRGHETCDLAADGKLLDDAEVDATADVAAVGVLAVVAGFAMGVLEQSAALVLGAAPSVPT